MALVVKDRVKETTATTGSTDAYNLAGAVTGFQTFNAVLSNGDTTYYCCTDGTDFEVGIGTFASSGTTLARTTILESSNSNNAVNWSSGTRDIFITQPAEKAVFLNADGDIEFVNDQRIKIKSNASDPVLDIAGSGPNRVRFRQSTNFTDTANGIDLAYRTNPDDMRIERSSNQNIIAEFGGDDGHAALYFDNSKKLETLTGGVDVTGNITVSGTVDGRDVATDGSKLDGIEASADVTDTTNVTAAGALMDSEVTNLAQVKAFDSSDYATAAQGSTADAAMPKAGGTFTGDVTFTGANYNIVFDKSDDALEFADNAKATFGADADLQIYHDGSHSYIKDTGTGNIRLPTSRLQIRNAANNATMLNAVDGGKVGLFHNGTEKLATTSGGVEILSTDAGDSEAPTLQLYRNSASPATNDDTGAVIFNGENSADEKIQYVRLDSRIGGATDGAEYGRFGIDVMTNGSSANYYLASFSLNQFYKDIYLGTNVDITFEGTAYNDHETTLTVTNPTDDRTITLPDATGTVQLTDGSGASLTSLNASELGSGTVPNARLDQQLQDVAGLAVTNSNFIVGDGSNFVAESGATARTSLGLGSIATQASNNVSITGGSVSGITDLAIADGGTGASSASAARTNLGLGTAAVAATGISNGNVPVFTSGVADNDFLRVNGTSIEGRSVTELASDIGAATTDDATALAIALG